jgi:hypothetical protein
MFLFARFLGADDANELFAAPGEDDSENLHANPAQSDPAKFAVIFPASPCAPISRSKRSRRRSGTKRRASSGRSWPWFRPIRTQVLFPSLITDHYEHKRVHKSTEIKTCCRVTAEAL